MYQAFYGLKDIPFSIAPNPQYLFLSTRHKEALSHLQYCLNSTGGFVLLTGEVGTGKTTLARTLLASMPEHTDIASILNPSLTEIELLATLCDELSITYPTEPSLKQLVDVISKYLLNNHHQGRQTLLVIDEAQHLRPEVLEQLRLLTNLETDQKKLLQVILIGQPELQQQLKQQHLRQLAQRISARYHLMPLSQTDVSAYIAHRLNVAGRANALFSKKSCDRIFQLSEGIPRVINLICDKALLLAYGEQLTEIGVKSVNQAAEQILFIDYKPSSEKRWLAPLMVSVGSLVVGFGMTWGVMQAYSTVIKQPTPIVNVNQVKKIAPAAVTGETRVNFSQQLQPYLNKARLRQSAFSAAMALWGTAQGASANPCSSATQYGLACFVGNGWSQLIEYNHPAVVSLETDNQKYFGVIVSYDGQDQVLLQLHDQQMQVDKSWLLQHWTGDFTVLWQPPTNFNQYLKLGDVGAGVASLSQLLNQHYQRSEVQVNTFDVELERLVKNFQFDNQLTVDGIVGAKTMIALQVTTSQQGPVLVKEQG